MLLYTHYNPTGRNTRLSCIPTYIHIYLATTRNFPNSSVNKEKSMPKAKYLRKTILRNKAQKIKKNLSRSSSAPANKFSRLCERGTEKKRRKIKREREREQHLHPEKKASVIGSSDEKLDYVYYICSRARACVKIGCTTPGLDLNSQSRGLPYSDD